LNYGGGEAYFRGCHFVALCASCLDAEGG